MKIRLKDNSEKHDPRFVIVDDNDKIIDDAQGYGYKSKAKAAKALWYKFKGGENKIKQKQKDKADFFKRHDGLKEYISNIQICYFKEMYRGEVTDQDIINEVKKEFGIDIPKEYLDVL